MTGFKDSDMVTRQKKLPYLLLDTFLLVSEIHSVCKFAMLFSF